MRKIIDGKGETKNNDNRGDQNAIRRAKKAAQRPIGSKVETPKDTVIASTVKVVRAYDAVDYVVAAARGHRAILTLNVGSPEESVALKVVEYYQKAETATRSHRARLMVAEQQFKVTYPNPRAAHKFGYRKAIAALSAGATSAEHLRELEIKRAHSNATTALDMLTSYRQPAGQLVAV